MPVTCQYQIFYVRKNKLRGIIDALVAHIVISVIQDGGNYIQGVSGGIVNILGGGSMEYSD